MPSRVRRAGARAGALSDELRAALRAEVERLEQVEDPVLRIRAVNDLFAAMDTELGHLAAVRLRAVSQLRRAGGWSYERLTEATGLSKSRVAQLVRESRVGRRGAGAAR